MSLAIALFNAIFELRECTLGCIVVSEDEPFTKSQTKCSAIDEDPPLPQVKIVLFFSIESIKIFIIFKI